MDTQTQNIKGKILIVDDDIFLLDMYALKFKQQGYEVSSATDANIALSKLRNGDHPNAILLDIAMPTMDGFEFMEAMQKEKLGESSIKIVLSNMGDQADVERGNALGASAYIVKANNTPSEVVEKVEQILGEHKA
jgi:CheY-like chemotaxis protein